MLCKSRSIPPRTSRRSTRKVYPAPYNLHLNTLADNVTDGWIVYLDDDDVFTRPDSLSTIAAHMTNEGRLLLWKVQFPDGVTIPEDQFFGQPPRVCHISGIGFAFHTSHRTHAVWDAWSCSDYRVVSRLWEAVPEKVWIDDVLTGLQREDAWGGRGQ